MFTQAGPSAENRCRAWSMRWLVYEMEWIVSVAHGERFVDIQYDTYAFREMPILYSLQLLVYMLYAYIEIVLR